MLLTQTQEEELQKNYRVAFMIWIAFIISIFLYGLFVYFCETQLQQPVMPEGTIDKKTFDMLLIIIVALSFVSLYASFFMKNLLEKTEKIIKRIKSGAPDSSLTVCGALRIAMLVTLACRESIVIYGLFLYLISSDPIFFIYFAVTGFLLMFQAYPSIENWREKVQEILKLEPEFKI